MSSESFIASNMQKKLQGDFFFNYGQMKYHKHNCHYIKTTVTVTGMSALSNVQKRKWTCVSCNYFNIKAFRNNNMET